MGNINPDDISYEYKPSLPGEYYDAVKRMLAEADNEFVPPLSSREGTTDKNLLEEGSKSLGVSEYPVKYFENMKNQPIILAVYHRNDDESDKLVGFMSFIQGYSIGDIAGDYVSTVIVDSEYRRNGITHAMYHELMDVSSADTIFTRTWSTNVKHIGLLKKLHFKCVKIVEDDRGEGIDTVYYSRKSKLSFREKLRAYDLIPNFWTLVVLTGLTVLSIVLYANISSLRQSEIWSNILIAVFTSFIVSIITVLVDMIIIYRKFNHERIFASAYKFGLSELSLRKDLLLKKLLGKCKKEIWISGYRLILTDKLKGDFAKAVKGSGITGADVKAVICPPWWPVYETVYGKDKSVIFNYYRVFKALYEAGYPKRKMSIRFVQKPLFSDTYKIDNTLVAGPYLHNREGNDGYISAKDFFSYKITDTNSKLYELVSSEYDTLFNDAYEELDWDRFAKMIAKYGDDPEPQDESAREKMTAELVKEFRKCLNKCK